MSYLATDIWRKGPHIVHGQDDREAGGGGGREAGGGHDGSLLQRVVVVLEARPLVLCASSSQAFPMVYSAYKLNNQGDYLQP